MVPTPTVGFDNNGNTLTKVGGRTQEPLHGTTRTASLRLPCPVRGERLHSNTIPSARRIQKSGPAGTTNYLDAAGNRVYGSIDGMNQINYSALTATFTAVNGFANTGATANGSDADGASSSEEDVVDAEVVDEPGA